MADFRVFSFCVALLFPFLARCQKPCSITMSGRVFDAGTKSGLPLGIIYIPDLRKGAECDKFGAYKINLLCPGRLKVVCAYTGYKSDTIEFELRGDYVHDFFLQPVSSQMGEVVVTGDRGQERPLVSQLRTEIKSEDLALVRGATLGESLKSIPGVYVLQTGPTIFKPVIHGLHSNSILIFNNGVRLEGQQWGSEHAPEIDPFIATRLGVVKGAASIRYGSDAIGGIITVDPASMNNPPGIVTGEVNNVVATNNRMGVTSAILQGAFGKKLPGLTWRTQGTLRMAGNTHTPHYFLENTGVSEANYSGTLAYKRNNFGGEVFYSQFNTKLGIFTGSQVESIADMQAAIARPEPITPSYFSYSIQRPYQTVQHGMFKSSAFYLFKDLSRLDVIFARQQNIRKEYDYQPLNDTLNNPQLYLKLVTQTIDVIYKHRDAGNYSGSLGFNGITQGNVRLYQILIPNFRNYSGGIFYIGRWTKDRLTLEGGTRFDYRWLRVYQLNNNTAQVVTPTWNWENFSGMVGSQYLLNQHLSWLVNIGTAWRAPTVNELESNGVHQSAVQYEIGNPNLHTVQSYNLNTSIHFDGARFHGELGLYDNIINGYIFLKPDLVYIHTVRGAFPEYTYTQVNTTFRGIDLSATYFILDSLSFTSKVSMLYAWNKTIDNWLQLVPANRFEGAFRYGLGNKAGLKRIFFSASCVYTAEQTRVPPNSDYLPPPPGYLLVNANLGFVLPVGKTPMQFSVTATNLLNTVYRDYMDRFRYFNDEAGRNIIVRVKIPIGATKSQ
jgi:iron complex outermembrane recepter protein